MYKKFLWAFFYTLFACLSINTVVKASEMCDDDLVEVEKYKNKFVYMHVSGPYPTLVTVPTHTNRIGNQVYTTYTTTSSSMNITDWREEPNRGENPNPPNFSGPLGFVIRSVDVGLRWGCLHNLGRVATTAMQNPDVEVSARTCANLALASAVLSTIWTTGTIITSCVGERLGGKMASGISRFLKVGCEVIGTAFLFSTYALVKSEAEIVPCRNYDDGCLGLNPSTVAACKGLLITAGVLGTYGICRTLKSCFCFSSESTDA